MYSSRVSPSKENHIFLNSSDAGTDGNGDYTFTFKDTLTKCRTIQLVGYNFPYSWYNIQSTSNTLKFTENSGSTITTTIPIGAYSAYPFLSAIQTAINSAGSQAYTVTLNTVSNCITISTSGNKSFTILFSSTLAPALGMTANISSSSKSITFPLQMNLLSVIEIQIRLPNLINVQESNQNECDILFSIPLSGFSQGDQISSTNSASTELAIMTDTLAGMTVSVVDQNGYSVEFSQNTPWTLSFRITYW